MRQITTFGAEAYIFSAGYHPVSLSLKKFPNVFLRSTELSELCTPCYLDMGEILGCLL